MSSGVVDDEAFVALFESFERSALRLESRRHTDIEGERVELDAFLGDELPEVYAPGPEWWTEMVARQTGLGKLVRRTRVLDEPLTGYNRFMIYTGRANVSAGEDIRYLSRNRAIELELPDHDFWVFDSVRLVELRFTHDDRLLVRHGCVDGGVVGAHEEWARQAFAAAIRSDDYLSEDPTRAWPPVRVVATRGS